MQTRRYLILIAANRDTAAIAKRFMHNIRANIDHHAQAAWIDSKGAGVLVQSAHNARRVWNLVLADASVAEIEATRDMLVVELGKDWMARRDAKTAHWLASNTGTHAALS